MNLVNIDKASEFLGISKFTLRQWCGGRKIPFVKLERRVLFDLQDLSDFVEKRKVAARPRSGNGGN